MLQQSTSKLIFSKPFLYEPTTFADLMEYAAIISRSELCPKEHKGKPENIFLTIQLGAEIGLRPLQSIQNISVINGKPTVWGDAALALCQAQKDFVDIIEWSEGKIEDQSAVFYCKVMRKDKNPVVNSFSVKEAIQAGLFNRPSPSPWFHYKPRMMTMRPRSWALRTSYAHVLKGISIREEVEDYENITQLVNVATDKSTNGLKSRLGIIPTPPLEQDINPFSQREVASSTASVESHDEPQSVDYEKIPYVSFSSDTLDNVKAICEENSKVIEDYKTDYTSKKKNLDKSDNLIDLKQILAEMWPSIKKDQTIDEEERKKRLSDIRKIYDDKKKDFEKDIESDLQEAAAI